MPGNWKGPLLGTIVGGLIGLTGTFGALLLNQQRAENVEAKRAVGAARVLANNLRRGEDVMADSLTDCEYRLYDVSVTLSHDDLVLLAWRLEPEDWQTVAQGMASANLQRARSKQRRLEGHEFEKFDVIQIRYVIGAIDKARHALENVSGLKPYPRSKVRKEQARGRKCL